jgi:hypothetical protein
MPDKLDSRTRLLEKLKERGVRSECELCSHNDGAVFGAAYCGGIGALGGLLGGHSSRPTAGRKSRSNGCV